MSLDNQDICAFFKYIRLPDCFNTTNAKKLRAYQDKYFANDLKRNENKSYKNYQN